ncbi:MAG: leucyl aminopeptidase [Hyphococcus sp.]|nr:MAG: leucyl aminopeptidase [Marinicaulis sp.]
MRHELLKEYEQDAAASATKIFTIYENALDQADIPVSLSALAKANRFTGEAGSLLAGAEGVLLGVGDGSDSFIVAVAADKLPAGNYYISESLSNEVATLTALAWLIGGYRFDRYKNIKPAEAALIAPENADVFAARRQADAIGLVRDLVNTPAEDMTPAALEACARKLADEHGAEVRVIKGDELLENNFPLVHAVGRAAAVAPRLIDIQWGSKAARKLTLAGKGVTFDSGGLNMKSGAGMALMKKDMGGAAHALGLAQMIMSSKLDVRLRVLIPAVENAVSGNAFRPSDVLPSRKGLSVEIGNTDAEGRLILADALALGGEEQPDLMISLATLTGAARVALGPELVPFYTDDEELAEELCEASEDSADPVWRMPLWNNYDAMLSSQIADINHISGGSFAGSITAALFLRRFANDAGAWMHFDLYAWRPKAAPGRPLGGEAQAIRALFDVLEQRYRV